MKSWQSKEVQARHAIEEHGFVAQDANVLFRANCPNIDLVVFGKNAATYVQTGQIVSKAFGTRHRNC